MGVNLASFYFHCWACGPFSRWDVLRECVPSLSNKSLMEILKQVQTKQQSELFQQTSAYKPKRKNLIVPDGLGPLRAAHKRYLRGRGFDPKQIASLWKVQGIGIAVRLSWRIWIPVLYQGRPVSWLTRSVSDRHSSRYMSASSSDEILDHKKLLYGVDYCFTRIVVHEGPLDAWATGPGATATMGTAISQEQVHAIARFPLRIICFDNEPDAQKRANKLVDELSVFPGETFNVRLTSGKDAASCHKSEIRELRTLAGL